VNGGQGGCGYLPDPLRVLGEEKLEGV
jgi:hypothetical protein